MDNIFLIAVGILFLLAILDLVVGVSNDAVNFLNSAIGSKVSSRKTILIIASAGILIGVVTSAGLMEVARKGIYSPEHFYFDEIIFICLAVMLTDILLLDLFNTFALPTSTTVSIIFELLGAAFAMSVIKIISNNESFSFLFNINDPDAGVIGYMNWGTAGKIITGIFLSVFIAFIIGAIVQYISRLLFTYNYTKKIKLIGGIWTGIAITSLFYFLIFKGLKSTSEDLQEFLKFDYIKENKSLVMGLILIISTLIMQAFIFLKINVFKIIVLFGTFALAMAFAGNDLVNFIGVPISGFQSYNLWKNSGADPSELLMSEMAAKVDTPYGLILIAGVIMILTLWFSKKARSVTETEVNLGRQSEGEERFRPNNLSKIIVRLISNLGSVVNYLLPENLKKWINKSFQNQELASNNNKAFDLVRASVNLVVASILIGAATEMKLPLSTTFVSFMVAMGSSFADRAWGKENAVHRVAGVLNVIGGWLMTALIAFLVAALFLVIIYTFEIYGIVVLVLLMVFTLFFSTKYHKKKHLKTNN